jgi:hypothetical protein
MNIDERIEALVQSVELLASLHKDNERRYDERAEKTDRQIKRLGRYIHNVSELILDHEARLRAIEGDEVDDDQE